MSQRWGIHLTSLKNNNNCNKRLQKDWNTYGEENFSFELIEEVTEKENLQKREKYWYEFYKDNGKIYNVQNPKTDKKDKNVNLVNKLRDVRFDLRMDQVDFATFLGVNKTLYNKWELQHGQPSLEWALKIAQKTNRSIESFIEILPEKDK